MTFAVFLYLCSQILLKRMKKVLSLMLLALLMVMVGCRQKSTNDASEQTEEKKPKASVTFLDGCTYDFGVYGRREPVTCDFVFRNDGELPFVIDDIETSCGCTQVSYPKHPVKVGDTDTIHVTYDGNGFKSGYFVKYCHIYSNADTVYSLRIQGTYSEVLEEEWLKGQKK